MVRRPEDIRQRGGTPISSATIITTATIIATTATKRTRTAAAEAACRATGEKEPLRQLPISRLEERARQRLFAHALLGPRAAGSGEMPSCRRLVDQPPQRQAHRVVEIAIDKAAAAKLQPSNDTFKVDAALFQR